MKKLFLILFLFIWNITPTFGFETNYAKIYMELEVPTFSYVHGIDPGQYYDNKDAAYSIYPLFRLCSPLYFKSVIIEPGYYDLTPREYKGKDFLLFKDNGIVKYIIPAYKKELVPEGFYETHIPQPKISWWQKIRANIYKFIGEHIGSAQRKPQAKTYLEINDLDNNFVSLVIYFDAYRYYTIFRTVQL